MPEYTNRPVWEDVVIPAQPALAGTIDADVCIVGLGGSGLAAVDEALGLGKTAVGIDAGKIAGGAAGRNAGFLLAGLAKFYHRTIEDVGYERAAEIYEHTLEEMDRLERTSKDCVRRTGSLRIADDKDERIDCDKHLRALHHDGFEAEYYEGHEGSGILLPSDAVFHPMDYCRQNVERVLAGGAQLFENTRATSIEPRKVKTANGEIRSQHIIAAIDGRLEHMFPSLRPAVTTYRLQMLATEPDPSVDFQYPMYMRWGYDYLRQLPDKRVLMGGRRDCHMHDERTECSDPTDTVQRSIEQKLRELGITAEITHRWAASVAYTTSGLPVAKEVDQDVFAVGAYSATGNVVGRILARAAVRAAILGDRKTLDLFTKEAK